MANKNTRLDGCSVSFYKEVQRENILLLALDEICNSRDRGSKLKEWAYNYLKNNEKELYEEACNKYNNMNSKEEIKSNHINSNKNIAKSNKNDIKNKLNLVVATGGDDN